MIAPDLAAELAGRGAQEEISVIVSLADKVDPRLYQLTDRSARDTRLVQALRDKAAATQGAHRVFLQNQGAREFRELWAINGFAVTARAVVIRQLAARPGIGRIRLDSTLQAPVTSLGSAAPPEWNLSAVQAPQLWSLGFTGSGIVVANMDTGVDPAHPDLAAKWRGGNNSWYDPHGQHPTPYDPTGHGTQTMGIMVGGSAGGTAIGVAPDARWIAAKLYDDAGVARYSDIHLAFQWLLDPDGDPNTVDAPDVVNASWGLVGTAGQCINEFSIDIGVLKTAGIAFAFAAGNDGPAPLTSLSPANDPQGFAAGAVDPTLAIAGFSSRGQSACDGSIYPELVAPGVNVWTADLSFGGLPLYTAVTGTSFAAPHAAGAMALLAGAFPNASVGQLEAALTGSARDLGVTGEDNSYGYGLADVQAAYQFLLAGANSPPQITSTPPLVATAGALYRYAVTATDPDNDTLSGYLDVAPAGMVINAATGLIEWIPAAGQVGVHGVILRVTDGRGKSATQSFSVTVAAANSPPQITSTPPLVATTGTLYRYAVTAFDPDNDTLSGSLDVAPAGMVINAATGLIEWIPAAGQVGVHGVTLRVTDGRGQSTTQSFSVTVTAPNRAPVAANDSYSTSSGATLGVAAPGVLGNDTDPDGAVLTAVLASGTGGGSLTLNANGSFSYTPNAGFTGTDSFAYRAFDGVLYSSNAVVSISVTAAANTPPVARADSATAAMRKSGGAYAPVVINVLANDSDPDGNLDPATVSIAVAPNNGGTVAVKANGTVSYTPRLKFRGQETFGYRVRDRAGAVSNVATVTVTVN